MLPNTQQFRDALSALRVQTMADEEVNNRSLILCERSRIVTSNGSVNDEAEDVVLVQENDAPISLTELLEIVGDELFALQHPYTSPRSDLRASISSKILGLSVVTSTKTDSPVECLKRWLSLMSNAQVAQWVVFDSPCRDFTGGTEFGDFTYAPIKMPMLESRCRRAGSNFFEEHGSTFQGKLSLCRDNRRIKVIEIGSELPKTIGGRASDKILYRIVDDYYSEVARAEQSQFVADLESQQSVYGAAGMVTFRPHILTQTEGFTDWITIFTRDEKAHGWVTGGRTILQIPLPYPQQLDTAWKDVKQNLGLDDWQKRPLDQSIHVFCHYFNAAIDHYSNGRRQEAILHLVFSLEMLLRGSSYDTSTRDVMQRLACIVASITKRDFYEIVKFVERCYTMRNSYVHRGGKGTAIDDRIDAELKDNFNQLSEWASIVFGVALFSRKQAWCQGSDAHGTWLNRIEGVRGKCVSGLAPDTDEIGCLGLNRVNFNGGFVSFKTELGPS